MFINFSKSASRNFRNLTGWRTNRKIIVIESDDWGSIRMPSLSAYERLEKAHLNLKDKDAYRYNNNDTLATTNDLESLFNLLVGIKDKDGTNAVFTALSVVANPDFEKIKKSDFNEYFYEPFTETLKKYPGCENSFKLMKEGIEKKLIVPQFHGREHLNVSSWMKALKTGDIHTMLAFNEGMWGFVPDQKLLPEVDFQAAFLLDNHEELEYHQKVLTEGLNLFEKLFGYRSEYFVPPNGSFNNSLNLTLSQNGIKFRSAAKIQHEPLGSGKSKLVFHWLGQKEKNGIRYLSRNCLFEPSLNSMDWVDNCLNDIKIAFRWHKPAIISSHRVNYIGALNPKNRDVGLTQLKILLQQALKHWPDIIFITTTDLGKLIESDSNEK